MNCSDARMRSTNDATSSGCPTNAARTTAAITRWSASRSGRMTTPSATGGDGNRARRQPLTERESSPDIAHDHRFRCCSLAEHGREVEQGEQVRVFGEAGDAGDAVAVEGED